MNLFIKTLLSRTSCYSILFGFIFLSSLSQAQTIETSINLIEKYYVSNMQSAEAEMHKITPEYQNISNENKLRYIVMKISIAANQQNQFQLLKIKQQLPELLGRVDLCCTFRNQQYIGSHINMNASDNILA